MITSDSPSPLYSISARDHVIILANSAPSKASGNHPLLSISIVLFFSLYLCDRNNWNGLSALDPLLLKPYSTLLRPWSLKKKSWWLSTPCRKIQYMLNNGNNIYTSSELRISWERILYNSILEKLLCQRHKVNKRRANICLALSAWPQSKALAYLSCLTTSQLIAVPPLLAYWNLTVSLQPTLPINLSHPYPSLESEIKWIFISSASPKTPLPRKSI